MASAVARAAAYWEVRARLALTEPCMVNRGFKCRRETPQTPLNINGQCQVIKYKGTTL